MARSFPLRTEPFACHAAPSTVEVYDPAMCCPTGVCGPGLDPAVLQIARDIRWLQSRGVSVVRRGLAQEPGAFAANPRIAGLLAAFGDDALPATLVNDEVLVHGRYPTRDELRNALERTRTTETDRPSAVAGDCCAPGSGCC